MFGYFLGPMCFEIFKRIPIPAIKNTSDEPPALKNGKGIPVTGIDEVTTAIFTIICMAISAVMPVAI